MIYSDVATRTVDLHVRVYTDKLLPIQSDVLRRREIHVLCI